FHQQTTSTTPVVFNFGLTGTDLVGQFMALRRLVDRGIQPNYLVIEMSCPMLLQSDADIENKWNRRLSKLGPGGLPVLSRYCPSPEPKADLWLEMQLCPWYTNRLAIVSSLLPRWVPDHVRSEYWRSFNDGGWLELPDEMATPGARDRAKRRAFDEY